MTAFTPEEIREAHRQNEERHASFHGDPRATMSPKAIAHLTVDEVLARLESASEREKSASDGAPLGTARTVRNAEI